MEDVDRIKQRFELLKMARDLLNEKYINKRAEDHNKWVADNDMLWRLERRNLPYPPFAQYPTDDEVVKSALTLYKFLNGYDTSGQSVDAPITSTGSFGAEIKTENEEIEEFHKTNIEIEESQNLSTEEYENIDIIDKAEDVQKRSSTIDGVKKLLPGWTRRSSV